MKRAYAPPNSPCRATTCTPSCAATPSLSSHVKEATKALPRGPPPPLTDPVSAEGEPIVGL